MKYVLEWDVRQHSWKFNISRKKLDKTRKATGFKSLRLNHCQINQATPKCQIDFWTVAKKV